jgi:hypothetical protein
MLDITLGELILGALCLLVLFLFMVNILPKKKDYKRPFDPSVDYDDDDESKY